MFEQPVKPVLWEKMYGLVYTHEPLRMQLRGEKILTSAAGSFACSTKECTVMQLQCAGVLSSVH